MIAARASGANVTRPAMPRWSLTARSMTSPRSSSDNGSRVNSKERDSKGAMTENDGFSVVAATRITHPFSTPGSSASCCAFVKRWISSRNSTVEMPYRSRADIAFSITRRTSLTPALTADSSTKFRPRTGGDSLGQRRLAGSGRAPQDHRNGTLVRGVLCGEADEWRSRREQMALPDDLIEALGPHPHGERRHPRVQAKLNVHHPAMVVRVAAHTLGLWIHQGSR